MVGSAAAYALVLRGVGSRIVLTDIDAKRARAEAEDIAHAVPFAHPTVVEAGDMDALTEAGIVILAFGWVRNPERQGWNCWAGAPPCQTCCG